MRLTQIRPEFVSFAPEVLEPGVAYVSMEYATVLHLCCCGCGNQVVTPLSPARWHLSFDGKTISLNHSIGNWSFPCQSHYWIERNAVVWDRPFSQAEIAWVRGTDRRAIEGHASLNQRGAEPLEEPVRNDGSWLHRVKRWLRGQGSGPPR
jgi:hypothetical protein